MLATKTFMLLVHFGLAFGVNRKYSLSVTDACYQPYDGVIVDVNGIQSPIACSALCAGEYCCSVMFHEMSQRCITSDGFAPNTTTGCGWKYAEIDSDMCPKQYTPIAPNQCDHGYSYDASNNKCRVKCVSYGSTYGRFVGYLLGGHNNRVIKGILEQECKDACTSETTFECRTAEWSIHVCRLSVETALTLSGGLLSDPSFTLWQRNCA